MTTKRFTRTRHIAIRVSEDTFSRLQSLADTQQKTLREWCRDKLLSVLNEPPDSPASHVLLAEIAATQNITISLLYAYARDGQLPEVKVREILDRARRDKFGQATELLRQAGTILGTAPRPLPASPDKPTRRPL
ncbi:MAG TPA: hypothetical protein VI455_16930 [Terriglobia bacterium]